MIPVLLFTTKVRVNIEGLQVKEIVAWIIYVK